MPSAILQENSCRQSLKNCNPKINKDSAYAGISLANDDKAWLASMFPTHLPASREDVLKLREYLSVSVQQLESEAQKYDSPLLLYAQQATSLYYRGFHELTRQVG